MKFTSIPPNGSSWSDTLPISFDTESPKPIDTTLSIITPTTTLARRKLYGVTSGTIDIAPYLKPLSCSPPTITATPTITTSPSSQQLRVEIDGVSTSALKLFHAPFDIVHPHMLSYSTPYQRIVRGEPILLTLVSNNSIQLTINYVSKSGSTKSTITAKSAGLPMDVVIPTATINERVTTIDIEIASASTTFEKRSYRIVEPNGTTKSLMWYNKMGGIEQYTFPHVVRTSYKANLIGDGNNDALLPVHIKEASVHYRLSSAHESPVEIERLSEIIFSPRIFLIEGEAIEPITIDCREVIFDSHGRLKQLCIDITELWEGGVR